MKSVFATSLNRNYETHKNRIAVCSEKHKRKCEMGSPKLRTVLLGQKYHRRILCLCGKNRRKIVMKNLKSILPFLESDALYELALAILNDEVDLDLPSILPVMEEEDVDKLCEELTKNPEAAKKINLEALYPYASEEYVDKLFLNQVKQGNLDMEAVTFVSDDCLHEVVLEYAKNPDLDIDIDELYPYLDDEDITLLFRTYLKNCRKKHNSDN